MQTLLCLLVAALAADVPSPQPWVLKITGREKSVVVLPDGSGQKDVAAVPSRGLLSPDGTRILYANGDDGDAEVYTAKPDGTDVKKLTDNAVSDGFATWSADGKRIAFISERDGRPQAYVMDSDGANVVHFAPDARRQTWPRFAPDGRLAFLVWSPRIGKGLPADLVLSDGKTPKVIANAYISDYAFSPDGKFIAYSTIGSLIILELATGEQQSIGYRPIHPELDSHAANSIAWRPDGKVIACRIQFMGGRQQGTHIFGDDEIFILPRDGKPTWFKATLAGAVEWVKAEAGK